MQVLYHVDEVAKWGLTLGNVRNMADYYRKESEVYSIEVVANSEAVKALVRENARKLELLEQMTALHGEGVAFMACNNALNAFEVARETLCDFVRVVPAGVVEIAQKQADGYAYIKP